VPTWYYKSVPHVGWTKRFGVDMSVRFCRAHISEYEQRIKWNFPGARAIFFAGCKHCLSPRYHAEFGQTVWAGVGTGSQKWGRWDPSPWNRAWLTPPRNRPLPSRARPRSQSRAFGLGLASALLNGLENFIATFITKTLINQSINLFRKCGTQIQVCAVAIVAMCLIQKYLHVAGLDLGLSLEDLALASRF